MRLAIWSLDLRNANPSYLQRRSSEPVVKGVQNPCPPWSICLLLATSRWSMERWLEKCRSLAPGCVICPSDSVNQLTNPTEFLLSQRAACGFPLTASRTVCKCCFKNLLWSPKGSKQVSWPFWKTLESFRTLGNHQLGMNEVRPGLVLVPCAFFCTQPEMMIFGADFFFLFYAATALSVPE